MSNYRDKQIEQYTGIFKALSNPNRLRIFLRLVSCCAPGTVHSVEDGAACVGEIAQGLEIAPSTVSHHIKELYRAGLIRIKRRGQNVECWIDPTVLSNVADFFSH
jgi:ArsR family transcriptional regulator